MKSVIESATADAIVMNSAAPVASNDSKTPVFAPVSVNVTEVNALAEEDAVLATMKD